MPSPLPCVHGLRLLPLVAVALTLCLAPSASAAVAPRTAGTEGGSLGEFDQVHQVEGSLTADGQHSYAGSASALARYEGAGANGYLRGVWNVDWHDGDEVWYSAAFFLPAGFKAAMQGEVDLLRWDNWASHPNDTDWGGLVIFGSDRRLRLMRFSMGGAGDTTLVGPLDIAENRWVHLEVHQRLSARDTLSEVYVDGALAGRSTQANTYGRAIERLRVGIVAITSGRQTNPLTLWFDRVAVSATAVGPLTAVAPGPSPITPPAPTPVPVPGPSPEPVPAPDSWRRPIEPATTPAAARPKLEPQRVRRSATKRVASRRRVGLRVVRRPAISRRRGHRARLRHAAWVRPATATRQASR